MIIINNEELLRRPCEDVKPEEVGELISTLENELNHANRLGKNGIGLAAAQIGILKKIAIVRIDKVKIDLVNAKIEQGYDPIIFREEGCLSFPNRVEDTTRFQETYIIDNLVSPGSFITTGLLSIVCQHEIGHFNSALFMDHMVSKVVPIINKQKIHPNDPCHCGSGKKYKRCHQNE